MREAHQLGASLYVPAIHKDAGAIAGGQRLAHVRSVIFCTEDSIYENELSLALSNLSYALRGISTGTPSLFFVRARDPSVLEKVLAMEGAEHLAGFVLPKVTRHNFDSYYQPLRNTKHWIMPTLETAEVFDEQEMLMLRRQMGEAQVAGRILALRIGGNDLLALLGMRRPRDVTIYRTPLGAVIAKLVTLFGPSGFSLTAPVLEHIANSDLLHQEVVEDLRHGLRGKTAIHPDQVPLIERHYRVARPDLEMARKVLDANSPAVFKMNGSVCEVATHRGWAELVVTRAQLFGVSEQAASV